MRVAVHDQNEYIKKPPGSHLSLEACPGEVPFDGPAAVDIWAAGVMVFVMLIGLTDAGRAATLCENNFRLITSVQNGPDPRLPWGEDRPSAADRCISTRGDRLWFGAGVFDHPWLTQHNLNLSL